MSILLRWVGDVRFDGVIDAINYTSDASKLRRVVDSRGAQLARGVFVTLDGLNTDMSLLTSPPRRPDTQF